MICPRDKNELQTEVFCGVEIDSCTFCDGTFLDSGELAKIVGLQEDLPDGIKIHLEPLRDRGAGERLICPRCTDTDMEPYHFSVRSTLILDVCPKCRGIWLDTEELKKVIQDSYRELQI